MRHSDMCIGMPRLFLRSNDFGLTFGDGGEESGAVGFVEDAGV